MCIPGRSQLQAWDKVVPVQLSAKSGAGGLSILMTLDCCGLQHPYEAIREATATTRPVPQHET